MADPIKDQRTLLVEALTALAGLKELPGTLLTSLNLTNEADLPDVLKAPYISLKEFINSALAKLTPVDQVPASLDASYALNTVGNLLEQIGLITGAIKQQYAALVLNAVEKAELASLNARVLSGDLVAKAQVDTLIAAARTDAANVAVAAYQGRQKKLSDRTAQAVTVVGLNSVPEAVLLIDDDAAYVAELEAAKARMAGLGEIGLALNGVPENDAVVTEAAWDENAFKTLKRFSVAVRPKAAANLFAGGGDPAPGKRRSRVA